MYLVGHTDSGDVQYKRSKASATWGIANVMGRMMFAEDYQDERLNYISVGMGEQCATKSPTDEEKAKENRIDVYIMFGEDSLYGLDLCNPETNI